jgi:hypothetical protein
VALLLAAGADTSKKVRASLRKFYCLFSSLWSSSVLCGWTWFHWWFVRFVFCSLSWVVFVLSCLFFVVSCICSDS